MTSNIRKWIYGLSAAGISGGAASVVSGLMTMGFAPDKFNLSSLQGFLHLLALIAANFVVSGILGAMLYLRQSPLPAEDDPVMTPMNNPALSRGAATKETP